MKRHANENVRWRNAAYIILSIMSLGAILPFILMIASSFTDNAVAISEGFSFFPSKFSVEAYRYIGNEWQTVGRAYFMTILVTIIGTIGSLVITSMFAYALSNRDMPGQKILMFLCVFTMLFNGGIVSSYYMWSAVFHIRNTIWALIVPNLMMNAFTVILIKNYYQHRISPSIKEAACIDGASEFKVFIKIVLPLSLPILATVGLMGAIAYWNDWTNGLYYLTERNGSHLYTIQLVLNSINENVNFLANNSDIATKTAGTPLPSTTIRMAIAVVGILPIMAAYPFFQKYFVKGITLGGVKE